MNGKGFNETDADFNAEFFLTTLIDAGQRGHEKKQFAALAQQMVENSYDAGAKYINFLVKKGHFFIAVVARTWEGPTRAGRPSEAVERCAQSCSADSRYGTARDRG